MYKADQVSVIIPTVAEQRRFEALQRCVASIRGSSNSRCLIIAVVNGSRSTPEVVEWLRKQRDVKLIMEKTPSAPNAVRIGREAVETPYFSTLDDDDEYLAGSTDRKMQTLLANPDADLVVTNGLNNWGGKEALHYSQLFRVPEDPLSTLFDSNWLASCNALYRSDRVTPVYFQNFHPFAEWTWLAFSLGLDGKKIAVLDEPCFRYNQTPQSLSQSTSYQEAYPSLFARMLASQPPLRIRKLIQRRLSAALHDRSVALLQKGDRAAALTAHLRSLLLPGGSRYLTYTRRLIPGWPQS